MNGLYSETGFNEVNASAPETHSWTPGVGYTEPERDWGKLASEAKPETFAFAFTLDQMERINAAKARLAPYVNALENYADEVDQARDKVYGVAAAMDLQMAAVAPWHFVAVLKIRDLYEQLTQELRSLANRVSETYDV